MPKVSKSGLAAAVKAAKPAGLLWKGPETDGITFSMLAKFLTCRERFRVAYVVGLKPPDAFNHRIEYGQMWHVCEEALAEGRACWSAPLHEYAKELVRKYPLAQEQIVHWYEVCKVQFAEYVRYWAEQPDVTARTPLLQEYVFDVPYTLLSGRTVRLRGKFDTVDLIGTGKAAGTYLQENKTKGDVDEQSLTRQLTFDLQTMMYLTALDLMRQTDPAANVSHKIKGVRYNVVRRPLSGGAGSIVRKKGSDGAKCPKCKGAREVGGSNAVRAVCPKCGGDGRINRVPPETAAEFYGRLRGVIAEQPGEFFMRWKTEVSPSDVAAFRHRCLDPLLIQVCDWYEWVTKNAADPFEPDVNGNVYHWQHPFGVPNTIDEYGHGDLDEFIATGSTVGLVRREKLFTELET